MRVNMCLTCHSKDVMLAPRHHIVCMDGTTLSVQVGQNLYCYPRNNEGPWTHVEVGYPSVTPPDTWLEYAETCEITSDVFSYVPVALVEEFINAHGGRKVWV